MTYSLIADIISLVFILAGALLAFSAAVGVFRFRDTMSRVHAVTKPQTTSLILTMIGALFRVTGYEEFTVAEAADMGIIVLLVFFALMTSPVTAQRLGRIARREGLYGTKDRVSRNDAPAERPLRRR